ncbi:MAG: hypothetical protein WBA74_24655 [Cyclobacteriaceae bacterium]
MSELDEEIVKVLEADPDEISLENVMEDSPLNQPVVEKAAPVEQQALDTEIYDDEYAPEQDPEGETIMDAPEQVINEHTNPQAETISAEDEKLLDKEFGMMADSAINGLSQLLMLPYPFVRIKPDPELMEYEETANHITESNQTLKESLPISKEEKAMLKPPLKAVLRKRAVKISPESQLAAVTASILLNKAALVYQMAKANKALVTSMKEQIKEMKAYQEDFHEEDLDQDKVPEEEVGNETESGDKKNG